MLNLRHTNRRSDRLIGRETSLLLVVDLQAKLLPLIATHKSIVWNSQRLLDGAQALSIPHVVTEQYPEKLGGTTSELDGRRGSALSKRMFSCRECFDGLAVHRSHQRRQIVLCGIESHVCVLQTALDLVSAGWDVFAVVDAMGSRAEMDHAVALQRMSLESVVLTTTESVLFEWCETSTAPEFRAVSGLVRQARPE